MALESFQVKRRLPAVEKSISEINQQDIRVKLLGMIIDRTESSIILDDGSGKIEIFFDNVPEIKGNLIRVIARVFPLIDGLECRGEVVQNLEGFDISLYKRAKEIIKGI